MHATARREGAKSPPRYKEDPVPASHVADHQLHHPNPQHQGLPPLQQQPQYQRAGVIQQQQQQPQQHHHHPESPHHSQPSQRSVPAPYASPHVPTHSLPPQHHSPYVASLPGPSGPGQPDIPYYTQPSPYSTNSASGSYSSSEQPIDPSGMATATMNPRYPPLYHTPQSASPASIQSPQHDQHGRPLYQQPMYPAYPSYSIPQQQQQPPYAQHPVAPQPGPINTSFMPQQPGQMPPQHQSHPVTPALTGSPGTKMQPGPLQRHGPGMSPQTATSAVPPGGAPGIHQQGPGAPGNPSAAPGPIPATTPLVVRQDQNGVQWIAFEYSRDRVKMEYTIRCDVESVDVNSLLQDFKTENCVYPRACCPKDQYKGNRLHYETECNTVGWALAQLNPCLRGKRGLIQRAVDSWRNSNSDPRLRSRRVRRMAKINNRKAVAAQHGGHMGGPGAPTPAGVPTPGVPTAVPRQPQMAMAGPQLVHHHHEQPGGGPPTGAEDVSAANEYNETAQTHHHQAPNGNTTSPNALRQTHNFYPPYPASQVVASGIPAVGDGGEHVGSHVPAQAVSTSKKDDEAQDNLALFGDLPEAKRRKFILVDDPQRGTRVRVRVMLDQVRMHEMPDSYRKNNSVYPRSWFPTEMQSPPPSPRRGRWSDDAESDEASPRRARTPVAVPVPILDGSETKLPMPRMTRTRRNKEVTLNDLGYRMSWSQSRVFSGRTLFLQRSLDAYRNKMRSTMVAAGQDVTSVAPHFETRVGKRKWLERSKRARREGTP